MLTWIRSKLYPKWKWPETMKGSNENQHHTNSPYALIEASSTGPKRDNAFLLSRTRTVIAMILEVHLRQKKGRAKFQSGKSFRYHERDEL